MAGDIVVVGSLNMDLIVKVRHLPRPGETVIGGEVGKTEGGKGGNQAVAASRLGAHVLMVGRVGRDENGEQLVRGLKEDGVDTAFISRSQNGFSGLALIYVDEEGQNMIVVSPGANWHLTSEVVNEALDVIRKADMLLLQLEIPLPTVELLADFARRNNVPVILNPSPMQPIPDSLISNCRYLVLNEVELEMLSGQTIQSRESIRTGVQILHQRGAQTMIVTRGSAGAYYNDGQDEGWINAYPVEAVDTIGAGDTFVAALGVSIMRGQPLPDAMRYASAAAALATTRKGARTSMPYRSDVERLLSDNPVNQ